MSDELKTLLGEWKALGAAATEGPWGVDGGGEIGQHWSRPEPWEKIVSTDVACMAYCYGGSAAGVEREADAGFIAASRTLVPRLIAAVEAVLDVLDAEDYRVYDLRDLERRAVLADSVEDALTTALAGGNDE